MGNFGLDRSIRYIRKFRMNSSNPCTQCHRPPAQYAIHNLGWYGWVSFKSFFAMKYYSCLNIFVRKDDPVLDCQYSNRQQLIDVIGSLNASFLSQSTSTSEHFHSKILWHRLRNWLLATTYSVTETWASGRLPPTQAQLVSSPVFHVSIRYRIYLSRKIHLFCLIVPHFLLSLKEHWSTRSTRCLALPSLFFFSAQILNHKN